MKRTIIGCIGKGSRGPMLGWPVTPVDVWDSFTTMRIPVRAFMWDSTQSQIIPIHGRPATPVEWLYLEDMSDLVRRLYDQFGRMIIGFNVVKQVDGKLVTALVCDPTQLKDNDPDVIAVMPLTYPMIHKQLGSEWIRVFTRRNEMLFQYAGSDNFAAPDMEVENYITESLSLVQQYPKYCDEVKSTVRQHVIPEHLRDRLEQTFTRREGVWRNPV